MLSVHFAFGPVSQANYSVQRHAGSALHGITGDLAANVLWPANILFSDSFDSGSIAIYRPTDCRHLMA